MKSIKITHSFSCKITAIHDALHALLSEDKRAKPSWSPDGQRVCVVYDDRSKIDSILSRVFYPKILDVTISQEGVLTVACASSWWFDLSGSRSKLAHNLIENLISRLKET